MNKNQIVINYVQILVRLFLCQGYFRLFLNVLLLHILADIAVEFEESLQKSKENDENKNNDVASQYSAVIMTQFWWPLIFIKLNFEVFVNTDRKSVV